MKNVLAAVSLVIAALGLSSVVAAEERTSESKFKIPPHYKLGSGGCRPGSGYSFVTEAPGHPSTYPKLVLKVFNGELVGMIFEVDAGAGWKPWYDQPNGKPISHAAGPAHYSQAIYIQRPPTAEECASSTGPWKHEKPN